MKSIFLFLGIILSLISISEAQEAAVLRVGDDAPSFTLPYATKDSIARVRLRLDTITTSKRVLIAFYPADWSSGCTKEFCVMRDNLAQLSDLKVELLAISGDYIFSHHEWAKANNFSFKLLSDHDHAVARKYNSYNHESGYNKRTVYLVDIGGKISYIDLNYSVSDDRSFKKLRAAIEGVPK